MNKTDIDRKTEITRDKERGESEKCQQRRDSEALPLAPLNPQLKSCFLVVYSPPLRARAFDRGNVISRYTLGQDTEDFEMI